MDIIKQLLGRLHPLLVHLPIGFIVMGLLFQWYDHKKERFRQPITIIYLWAAVSAVLTCITGYLQYTSEGFAFDTIKMHLWLGIITALFSFLMYLRLQEKNKLKGIRRIPTEALAIIMLILISLTGHLGGSVTHGEDYLVEPLPNSVKSALGLEVFEEKIIALNDENWERALFYEDVINPILNNNCVSCHNRKKAKGELVLNTKDGILEGGENGEIIVVNNSGESTLFTRLKLPRDDEDHMPPKEKTQLTKGEITLIETWITHGTPFEASIGELDLSKELFEDYFPKKANFNFPDIMVEVASIDSVNLVKKAGLHVEKISKESNYLRVSCVNKSDFSEKDFAILNSIYKHIAILDLGGTLITDQIFELLGALPHITALKLDNTALTGSDIEKLTKLEYLRSLNLTSTKFDEANLNKLEAIPNLEKVFLHNTLVTAKGVENNIHTDIHIDLGNYELPVIVSDSIIY